VRASLNDGHPRPGIGQAPRHQRTGNAGAHDQYVGLLGQKNTRQILEGAEAQLSGPPPQMLGGGSIPAARHIKVVSKLRISDNPSSLKRPVYQASSSLFSNGVPR
jgi:hypothetical protein